MKICIPIQTDEVLKAKVSEHFGSSPYFLIYDTDSATSEVIANSDEHHVHGRCHPLNVLAKPGIAAVVCKGMGARAVQKLNEYGIRVYRAVAETAEEAAKRCKEGALEELTTESCCADHHCH